MLVIKKENDNKYYLVGETIWFSDEVKGDIVLEFKCHDGVDFNIKINEVDKLNYSYDIPSGMANQTYSVTVNANDYISNEVVFHVEQNIKTQKFRYNDKVMDVKWYDDVYENKRYYSLTDVCKLLKGTDKEFSFNRLSLNKIFVNDKERRYYTYIVMDEVYIFITDLMLLLNSSIEYGVIYDIKKDLIIDMDILNTQKSFDYLHGCIVGDIDSGEIFYKKHEDYLCAIASTSKLLTLLLTLEEIKKGNISYDTLVKIPEASERESLSEDGVVYLKKNSLIPVRELLDCLMLPSSNESAIALGTLIDGSEKEFVKRMNRKCRELGLEKAIFYNASGLPYYEEYDMPGKLQNRMTALEMFKLASYIIKNNKEAIEVTSKKHAYIPSLDITLTNTNPVLFNMDECLGLKTGTTNRAGCCLVSYCKFNDRRIVSVVFGAETSQERGEKSELLMRYARQEIEKSNK